MGLQLENLRVEFASVPIGLDEKAPRISYEITSDRQGAKQISRQIKVIRLAPDAVVGGDVEYREEEVVWDSGVVEEEQRPYVVYAGEALKPRTCYGVEITVTDDEGESITDETYFETGLMTEEIEEGFPGASFIGPDETVLMAKVKSAFRYHAKFRLPEGSDVVRFIFSANDPRLLDANKNDYGIAGPNEIAYEVNVAKSPAEVKIYRIGYCPEDKADTPLACFLAHEYEKPEHVLIDEKNAHDWHTLDVEVAENGAYAFIDGVKADGDKEEMRFRAPGAPASDTPVYRYISRQLNPAGHGDVTPYPMLNEIGIESAAGVEICELQIFNLRSPSAMIFDMKETCQKALGQDTSEAWCVKERVLVDPTHTSVPMLRRTVDVKEGLLSARLYVTARGIYNAYINGEKVSDHWFDPGAGQYDTHILYQSYDVTDMILGSLLPAGEAAETADEEDAEATLVPAGKAGIGFLLSSGWWNESQTFTPANFNYWGDRQSVLAELILGYADGTEERIVTEPDTWKYCGEGPVTYAGYFYGEHFDGRKAQMLCDFSKPDYDDSAWGKPIIVETVDFKKEREAVGGFHMWPVPKNRMPKLVGYMGEPVRVVMELDAKEMAEPRPGVYIYDMGQNMIGVPKIHFKGAAGQQAVIRYGEIRYPYLPQYGALQGMILTENYRDAISTDRYTFRGDADGETFMPDQTFHGYRFVEITGVDEAPAVEDVKGVVLSSIDTETGTFTCDNPLVNRFFQNVRWSQFANFVSIPTDCPQRNERMGWAGDAEVFARTATYNADVHNFYRRYLLWLRDCQLENGRYPDIAPVGGGFGGIEWGSAGIIVTYETWRQYGDVELIRENFAAMDRYIEFLKSQGTPGKLDNVGPLPDWLASDLSTDGPLLWNAVFAYDCKIMAEMAKTIGETEKQASYEALCEEIKKVWNETYLTPETCITRKLDGSVNDTQASYALPLEYDVILPENLEKVRANLAAVTERVGFTVTTGFVGTGPLNPALTEAGHADYAYKLINQTAYPSWLYPVTQGATTIWERWNSYTVENGFGGNNAMNSFNHYSLGAVAAWIYGYVLGIKRGNGPEAAEFGAFKHFTYQPFMKDGFGSAEGYFDSPYGTIESSWKKTEEGYSVHFTVPVGSTATVILPAGNVICQGSLTFVDCDDEWQTAEAVSGVYDVVIVE